MSILVVAGKARCSRAKAGRSAWLLPSRGEDPGQANSLGVDTWTLGSRPGRRGQYLPPPAALLRKQHGFTLWSRTSNQLQVCFVLSSSVLFTFLH